MLKEVIGYMNKQPVYYMQTDPKWSKLPYTNKDEKATIGGSGCGPTSMAMVIAEWVDPTVTPVTTCNWAQKKGYKATGNGTYHSYFVPQAKAYGLECVKLNSSALIYMSAKDAEVYHKKAHDAVDEGCLVICLMKKGNWTKGGHYILWYSNDGDDVLINDPASKKSNRVRNTFKLLKSEVRFYWVVTPPKEVISMLNSEVKALVESSVKSAINNIMGNTINPAIDQKIRTALNGEGNVPSDWAKPYWYSACKAGLMDGTRPKGYITREQEATILVASGHCNLSEPPEDFDFAAADYFSDEY